MNTSSTPPIHRPPVRIGLLWHSLRSGNLGIGALTISNIAMLTEAALAAGRAPHFTVLGPLDRNERYPMPFDVPLTESFFRQKSLLPRSAFRRALQDCDIVFDIGAGDSFADLYGLRRFMFLLLTRLAVRSPRRRLVLSPQTIGPFKSFIARNAAPWIFRRARDVWTRDTLSLDRLKEIVPGARAHCTTDVAFALPFEPRAAARSGATRIGVNVSALLFRESAAGNNPFGLRENYAVLIDEVLRALSKRSGVSCVLVPHVIAPENPGEDDFSLAQTLAVQYGIESAPRFPGPCEAKSYIAGLDLLIGSRMHATIASLSAGVPVLPLGYSDKFARLFSDLSYPVSVDLRSATTANVLEALENLLGRLDEHRQMADDAARIALQSLAEYRRYLAGVLMDLA